MSTIVTIAAGDSITNSRADLNTNFANLNSDKIETSYLDTDTTLAANSNSKIPTQAAVKAYVDAGGNVNATLTSKGIVQLATVAQVAAGTATGSTGAALAVTPDVIAGVMPTGALLPYAGSAAPTGFLLCDGSSVLQSTYAALFAVISTTYGSADGTHFNVPDLRGRIPIGVGTGTGGGAAGTGLPTGGSALTAVARAGWKGEETHVITEAELAAHTHATALNGNGATDNGSRITPNASAGSASGTSTSGSAGSNTAHNNIQPVMGVNFIIKT